MMTSQRLRVSLYTLPNRIDEQIHDTTSALNLILQNPEIEETVRRDLVAFRTALELASQKLAKSTTSLLEKPGVQRLINGRDDIESLKNRIRDLETSLINARLS